MCYCYVDKTANKEMFLLFHNFTYAGSIDETKLRAKNSAIIRYVENCCAFVEN